MSNASDFIIENGVQKEYVGAGGDIVLLESIIGIYPTEFYGSNDVKSITILGKIQQFIGGGAFYPCKGLRTIISPATPFSAYDFQEAPAKRAAALGFLENLEAYHDPAIAEEYKKYAISQRKQLLPAIWESDCVAAIQFYADNKKITVANFENDYLIPATNAAATSCIAFLLEWKNTHITVRSVEKHAEKELTKDPCNAVDMKKIWSYKKLANGTLELTSYKLDNSSIVIPAKIGKNSVAALGEYLFSPETAYGTKPNVRAQVMKNIKEVMIPESITSIGSWAFSGSGIENISIPTGVVTIESGAFRMCYKLKSVSLPDSITSIGGWTFCDCSSLKTVKIPKNMTEIPNGMFSRCTSLTDITIGESVTYIGTDALAFCDQLTIHAPAGSYAESYAKEHNKPFVAE